MPDKWKNGITSIITLFTQSQNEFLIKNVCAKKLFSLSWTFVLFLFVFQPEKSHMIVLNILTILPEEVRRDFLFVSFLNDFVSIDLVFTNRRAESSTWSDQIGIRKSIRHRFVFSFFFLLTTSLSFLVLSYIQFIIATYPQADILSRMFSCLSKWLDFGIPVIKVESLFDYLFHSLNNENIFDDASNCIIALFTSPDAIK